MGLGRGCGGLIQSAEINAISFPKEKCDIQQSYGFAHARYTKQVKSHFLSLGDEVTQVLGGRVPAANASREFQTQ